MSRYSQPEIERRWLVDLPRVGSLAGVPFRDIEDLYLAGTRLRLRRVTGPDGVVAFKFCKKERAAGEAFDRITNLYLSPEEHALLDALPGSRIRKRRHAIAGGSLDVYEGLHGPAVFEVEFDSEAQASAFEPPAFVQQEITDEASLTGAAIAHRGAAPKRDLPFSAPADRNKEPILARLRDVLGERGTALEIASGTGQHAVWFAAALTGWTWQPTDFDAGMLPVIAERVAQAGLANVSPPHRLDVTKADWPALPRDFDAIYCANMLHIAPWAACQGLMAGARRHLKQGGQLVTYGPYFERGEVPAPSNLAFDENLRQRDPSWGIRFLDDVVAVAGSHGLVLSQRHAMPANNLLLVFTMT